MNALTSGSSVGARLIRQKRLHLLERRTAGFLAELPTAYGLTAYRYFSPRHAAVGRLEAAAVAQSDGGRQGVHSLDGGDRRAAVSDDVARPAA